MPPVFSFNSALASAALALLSHVSLSSSVQLSSNFRSLEALSLASRAARREEHAREAAWLAPETLAREETAFLAVFRSESILERFWAVSSALPCNCSTFDHPRSASLTQDRALSRDSPSSNRPSLSSTEALTFRTLAAA